MGEMGENEKGEKDVSRPFQKRTKKARRQSFKTAEKGKKIFEKKRGIKVEQDEEMQKVLTKFNQSR